MGASSFSGLLAALLLAGCAATLPAGEPVPLPPALGAGDAGRQAVLSAAYAFGDTRRLAGRPADAARAAAQLEWMAASLRDDPAWRSASPLLDGALAQARDETRAALGISVTAPPAAVARDLLAVAARLDGGGAVDAALRDRLGALPPLPRTAYATGMAQFQLGRPNLEDVD